MGSMGFRIVVGLQVAMLLAALVAALVYQSASVFWQSVGPSLVVAFLLANGAWVVEALERRKLAHSPEHLPIQSFPAGPARVSVIVLWVGLIVWVSTNYHWLVLLADLVAMALFLLWSFGLKAQEQRWLAEYAKR